MTRAVRRRPTCRRSDAAVTRCPCCSRARASRPNRCPWRVDRRSPVVFLRHVEVLVPTRRRRSRAASHGTGVVEDVAEHDPRAFRARTGAPRPRPARGAAPVTSATLPPSLPSRVSVTGEPWHLQGRTATGSVSRCRCRTWSCRGSATRRSPASATPSPPTSPRASRSARRCASRSTAAWWSTCGAAGSTPSSGNRGRMTRSPVCSRARKGWRRSRRPRPGRPRRGGSRRAGRSLLARVRRRGQGRAAGAEPPHARGGAVGDRRSRCRSARCRTGSAMVDALAEQEPVVGARNGSRLPRRDVRPSRR